jgi:hypothetical protein
MVTCNLTLRDWHSNKVQKKVIMPKDPIKASEIHSRNNPNCVVILEWKDTEDKDHFIQLRPYNMELDQLQVDEGEMSINRFTTKWYGKVSKAKMKQIEKELSEEFVEEEEEPKEEDITIDEE